MFCVISSSLTTHSKPLTSYCRDGRRLLEVYGAWFLQGHEGHFFALWPQREASQPERVNEENPLSWIKGCPGKSMCDYQHVCVRLCVCETTCPGDLCLSWVAKFRTQTLQHRHMHAGGNMEVNCSCTDEGMGSPSQKVVCSVLSHRQDAA